MNNSKTSEQKGHGGSKGPIGVGQEMETYFRIDLVSPSLKKLIPRVSLGFLGSLGSLGLLGMLDLLGLGSATFGWTITGGLLGLSRELGIKACLGLCSVKLVSCVGGGLVVELATLWDLLGWVGRFGLLGSGERTQPSALSARLELVVRMPRLGIETFGLSTCLASFASNSPFGLITGFDWALMWVINVIWVISVTCQQKHCGCRVQLSDDSWVSYIELARDRTTRVIQGQ